ncbi:MAG TPA: hypothetical protein VH879_02640 [Gemmatimonadales bacterium]|jgi:hypothetical protein
MTAARRLGGSATSRPRGAHQRDPGARKSFRAARHLLLGALLATAHSPLLAQTSITLYNDGRVLVRRDFALEIGKGQSDRLVVTGPVDPATVFTLDPEVAIVAGAYDGGIDQSSVLRRAIGRRLTFRTGKDTLSAEVVGVDPERYRLSDGTIVFQAPGIPQYPADLVTLEPRYQLTIASAQARKSLRLGYFTQGGGWTASYEVLLGGETARVMGQAVVNGGPLRFKDVELQLLAGQVNVAQEKDAYRPRAEAYMVAKQARADVGAPSEEKVGEFHVYTLPGRSSIEPGTITTVGLFTPTQAKVRKSFEVHGQIPYWGGLPQYGEEAEVPVTVTYTVERPRKTDLGDRPLPGGIVRLFEPDSGGRLQLIGEAAMDHAPAGEDLRLAAGTAFDLTAKRVQTSYATRRDSIPGGGWRTIATADYRVSLSNAADQAARVDVVEERRGEWSIVSSSIKPVKQSSTRYSFAVPVPAKGKATLTYRVRIIW